MELQRGSGILLHPTSLPGRFGIGEIGADAQRFVDFLVEAGQRYWQILPLGPTGYGDSPYMGFSAFGGNPLLIALEGLVEQDLLDPHELAAVPEFPADRVDYAAVMDFKLPLLRASFQRLRDRSSEAWPDDYYQFCEQHAFWLEDYALFMALKEVHGGQVWTRWDPAAARRDPDALLRWRNELNDEVQFRRYVQYIFFRQWRGLKTYAAERGIQLIGDLPIYVSHDSADVWGNRELFHLDVDGNPLVVAGVPPDYFSATGQRWGNPIYRWEAMAQRGYQWWIDRFRVNYGLVDLVRLDHFRGFEAYWEIPAAEQTAVNGRWVHAPGEDLFDSLHAALGSLPVLAEDLGVITPEVRALRERCGFPGMRILQMAFGTDPDASAYRPHSYVHRCVCYTATHDHNTTRGWFTAEPGTQTTQSVEEVQEERRAVLRYVNTDGCEIHWDFIRLALGSVADLAVIPLQDVLGLGSAARMNRPGSGSGNWAWRFRREALTPEICGRLRSLVEIYDRGLACEPPERVAEARAAR